MTEANSPLDEFATAPLWRCLEMALADLELCEASSQYLIGMHDFWHSSIDGKTCTVCLAGAVMAQTLDADTHDSLKPADYDKPINIRLIALDYLHDGDVHGACSIMTRGRGTTATVPDNIAVVDYHDDADSFKSSMRDLVKILREANI